MRSSLYNPIEVEVCVFRHVSWQIRAANATEKLTLKQLLFIYMRN